MTIKMKHAKLAQDPGEEALKMSLKRSYSKSDTKISPDEVKRLEKAFEDKEFRDLMAEYVNEISDPKHRAEQNAYITHLENQNDIPDGKIILRPRPGFVLKFKYTKERSSKPKKNYGKNLKLFINIVHSDMVAKPTIEDMSSKNNISNGKQWSLPYSFGPLRMENDKNKNLVPTFDCCFHPTVLLYASKSIEVRDLVAQTARNGATQQYHNIDEGVKIDTSYYILRGMVYKNGNPPVMIQGINKEPTVSNHDVQPGSDGKTARNHGCTLEATISTDEKEHISSSVSSFGNNLKKSLMQPSNTSKEKDSGEKSSGLLQKKKRNAGTYRGGNKLPGGGYVPEYEVIERGQFDIADATPIKGLQDISRRPKYLVFKVHLVGISSSSNIQLDISEERLELRSLTEIKRHYYLEVKLSYPVHSCDGTAKFDKAKSLLTVTLPVHRPLISPFITSPKVRKPEAKHAGIPTNSHEDMVKTLGKDVNRSESPVCVDLPTTSERGTSFGTREINCHSRWVSVEKVTNAESTREDFASDAVLLTLKKKLKKKDCYNEHSMNDKNKVGEHDFNNQTVPENKGEYAAADNCLAAKNRKQKFLIPHQSKGRLGTNSPRHNKNLAFLLD